MYAVSAFDARTAGLTSSDSVTTMFGNFTAKLTARGPNPNLIDWPTDQSVRDRPSSYPSASGHGHRP